MNGTYYLIYNDIEGVYYNEEHKLVPAPVDITDTKTVCSMALLQICKLFTVIL